MFATTRLKVIAYRKTCQILNNTIAHGTIAVRHPFLVSSVRTNIMSTPTKPSLDHLPKTDLIFHAAAHQQTDTHDTTITSIIPLSDLADADAQLFKPSTNDATSPVYALTTESTIFHPQGGGQPSDVGHITIETHKFTVLTARTSSTNPQLVLHFGSFNDEQLNAQSFSPNTKATLSIDARKRLLFSRLHTAGHALGAATRALLETKIDGFDELKASHFPDSASCEFSGSIDGKYKPEIQSAVDELVASDAPVMIKWWRKKDFKARSLERLLPEEKVWRDIAVLVDENGGPKSLDEGEEEDEETRIRIVEIVGTEVYPCGGTHVASTKDCGKVGVKKISRSKGTSRVSYFVD